MAWGGLPVLARCLVGANWRAVAHPISEVGLGITVALVVGLIAARWLRRTA